VNIDEGSIAGGFMILLTQVSWLMLLLPMLVQSGHTETMDALPES